MILTNKHEKKTSLGKIKNHITCIYNQFIDSIHLALVFSERFDNALLKSCISCNVRNIFFCKCSSSFFGGVFSLLHWCLFVLFSFFYVCLFKRQNSMLIQSDFYLNSRCVTFRISSNILCSKTSYTWIMFFLYKVKILVNGSAFGKNDKLSILSSSLQSHCTLMVYGVISWMEKS